MIYQNVWASVTVFAQQLIAELNLQVPGADLQFIDWEAAPNIAELPNHDLLGPTALTISDLGDEMISANFSLAVSTYTSDTNLFRHRQMLSYVFEKMRPGQRVEYFDAQAAQEQSVLIITPGTLLAPMTKASARPWQFVQAEALLVPS